MTITRNVHLIIGLLTFALLFNIEGKCQKLYKKLVWADEFNTAGMPDTAKWGYDLGRGCPQNCGWGNNELQYYTAKKENARVDSGKLILEARKEQQGDAFYTSSRLVSKNKGDWKYGRFEIMAKIPRGRGMWPAIWMLPTHWEYGGWPKSGEIDIMENVGYWPDSLLGTVHTNAYNGMLGTQKTKGVSRKDPSGTFHLYAIEWTADSISFFVDEEKYNVFYNDRQNKMDTWPFNKTFHLIMNIAVGGNWGGKYGVDDTIFPQRMEVDYVRVYQ